MIFFLMSGLMKKAGLLEAIRKIFPDKYGFRLKEIWKRKIFRGGPKLGFSLSPS